jgi:hypothetical protein
MSKEGSKMSKDPLPSRKEADDVTSARKAESISKEAQHTSRIRIKNRRKMYLDRHPSYFDAPDLELAGLGTFQSFSSILWILTGDRSSTL